MAHPRGGTFVDDGVKTVTKFDEVRVWMRLSYFKRMAGESSSEHLIYTVNKRFSNLLTINIETFR